MVSNELMIKFPNFHTKIFIDQKFCNKFGNIVKKNLFCQNNTTVVIITDEEVFNLFAVEVKQSFLEAGFKVLIFKLHPGEKSKSFKSFEKLCNFLAENKVKRTDVLVALGGGSVCDITGFVSGCYLRGVRLVNIPTTLLAMVDACVGGKTAINLKYGKNLVGCFKQPNLVFCNLSFVATLPYLQYSSAIAEVVKCAVLFSDRFFNFLAGCGTRLSERELKAVVLECLKIKKSLVEIDEFDEKGERIKLNFGHTIGHALETYFGHGKGLTHGQAVALGMSFCFQQGEKLGLTEQGEFEKLKFVLAKFKLPTQMKGINFKTLLKICLNDKKSNHDGLKLVLVKKIGTCFVRKFSLIEFNRFLKA